MPKGPRFRFVISAKSEFTADEVFPEGIPKGLDLMAEFKNITIEELINEWGLIKELTFTIADTATGKAITREGDGPWEVFS